MRTYPKVDAGPVTYGEMRLVGASKGISLTNSASRTLFPAGTEYLHFTARAFQTAVVARIALLPYLAVMKTVDGGATFTDYTAAAQDGSASTDVVLSSLPTLANGGAIYVGCPWRVRGLDIDVDAANGTASVIAIHYWNGTAWSALTVTDGTIATGATFGQDGTMTWTVPTDAVKSRLHETLGTSESATPYGAKPLHWLRLTVSAALDSSTTLNSLIAMPGSTAYAEFVENTSFWMRVATEVGGHAGLEALTDAGTANLLVNALTDPDGAFT